MVLSLVNDGDRVVAVKRVGHFVDPKIMGKMARDLAAGRRADLKLVH